MKYKYLLIFLLLFLNCKQKATSEMPKHKFTNSLINETSPYLLQHAHNPVDWYAWNDETLALAKRENKLILISVGYSACHWCHVMEHESFEDEEVAKLMNDNFINIKVDREERPDVDQVYMNAVQLITGGGGWPLNCIALPDGRPIWGGTYFSTENWINALAQIADLYQKDSTKIIEYATKLTEGVQQSNLVVPNKKEIDFSKDYIQKCVDKWSTSFDLEFGGLNRSPKFPMPTNYQFLMRHAYKTKNNKLNAYVNTTLTKMAYGGIFDQVGGGFARYSVDKKWHIPHFEKMLYDNGQLVSLYSDAYLITKNELYKETVYNTLGFIERELMHEDGGFYASLDADSVNEKKELEEGAFYVWKKLELEKIIGSEFDLFSKYYNINEYGFWEHESYNLIRSTSDQTFANTHGIDLTDFKKTVNEWKDKLLAEREKRQPPRLDDKILTSWNALMLKGYVDAYRVFNDSHLLDIANKNASFLEKNLVKRDGSLFRSYKNKQSTINAYLEDYATLIEAYILLYEVSLEDKWLTLAKKLTDYTFKHFYDKESNMFFFTSDIDSQLITKKTELEDNVLPASNSIMANNLLKLGHFYEDKNYLKTSRQMVHNIAPLIESYPSSYANWMNVYSNLSSNFYEVAIVGKDAIKKIKEINEVYIPNKIICASENEAQFPLLKNRFMKNSTMIYVCVNNSCNYPTTDSSIALKQLKD